MALGYVVFRGGLETVNYIASAISSLLLVPLSQAYLQAGAPEASTFQVLGAPLLKAGETSSTLTEIVFPLGALMFYYVLYQARLIPRWISGWGLVAAVPFFAAGLLHLFGLTTTWSTIQIVLVLPIAPQEMVLAGWLIVKGFNPSEIASLPAAEMAIR